MTQLPQISNRPRDRAAAALVALSTPAPFAATNSHTVWLDHLSYNASDYHTVTPNGFDLQISASTHDTRLSLALAVNPRRPGVH
jgi:hypothetical protein